VPKSFINRISVRFRRIDRARREVLVAGLFLLFVSLASMSGFILIEDWSPLDSLYMTFLTLTTIGFLDGSGRWSSV
jgi:voltage-gated potassium channel